MKIGDIIVVAPCNSCKYEDFYAQIHPDIIGRKSRVVGMSRNGHSVQVYIGEVLYTLASCNVRLVEPGIWWKEQVMEVGL